MIWAKVTTRFEATHNYPDAPTAVHYLRNTHRHEFHVTLWIEQFHDNRDVEYLMCKQWLMSYLRNRFEGNDMGRTSCEMFANWIAEAARKQFPTSADRESRKVMVEVNEDGENGALIELD